MQINFIKANFIRPADTSAYASGDLVANSTTAGSVVPMSFLLQCYAVPGQTILQRVRLSKSGTTATNATFRVHFYQASPTPSSGDNGAWSTDNAANYLGNIDVTALKAFTDGCAEVGGFPAGAELRAKLASGATIYALLEARAAYTPASAETFTLTLEPLDAY